MRIYMSYNEELFKHKLLNNEFIEDNSCWVSSDKYYGQSEDLSLNKYIEDNYNTEFGIRNIVFLIYNNLRNRYHNNFYLDFKDLGNKVIFILRGQPVFSDCYLDLVVKYTIMFAQDKYDVSCKFILPGKKDYIIDKNLIVNFREDSSLGIFGKLKKWTTNDDNSADVRQLLDSISLHNYVFHINNSRNTSVNKENNEINHSQKKTFTDKTVNNTHENKSSVDLSDNTVKTDTVSVPPKKKVSKDFNVLNKKDDTTNKEKKKIIKDWSNVSNKDYLIYCTNCGKENYPLNITCTQCNNPLITYRIDYGNEIGSFDDILCEDSIKKIENTKIPVEFYEYIKEIITKKCEFIDFSQDVNVYDKILRICRYYANIIPNDQMEDNGEYNFNSIVFNPTLSRSQQCATLIKYLAVDIHVEIMEYLFMYIFDVKNNVYVKSFINFMRNNLKELIIEKYYQAKVESHFIPEDYRNFEEVDRLYLDTVVYNKHIDEETFKEALIVGNSFAQEIIGILENIITENIKQDLAQEFVYDNEQKIDDLRNYEINDVVAVDEILKISKDSMLKTVKYLMEVDDAREGLKEMKEIFDNVVNS